jgi:hypothetical protein
MSFFQTSGYHTYIYKNQHYKSRGRAEWQEYGCTAQIFSQNISKVIFKLEISME